MKKNFKEALKNRRTYYNIKNESPVSDDEIKDIIRFALLHIPSAFNSQSTRLVLLMGEEHKKLWNITKGILQEIVGKENFEPTKTKIDNSFASGYGTILFYEDFEVIEQMQKDSPTYKDKFPVWSHHTSAMHQLAIWTMLEDVGFGASLQHYNPLIDQKVSETWNISPSWSLVAQMPFGIPTRLPGEKEFKPLEKRFLTFG